ncbi:putative multiple-sugar transport system permease YteP [Clostridia bacterium]|nr:putative multiple-sugar transport system permease YteP [Clostridia bacterium]
MTNASIYKEPRFGARVIKDWQRHKWKYLLVLPVIVFFIVFHYIPMYGIVIAFKKYKPVLGIMGSKWVGLQNFRSFFSDYYFVRIVRNTFLLSIFSLLFGFPMPILLALLLNELRAHRFKRTVQTITYIPHFISLVVICGLIRQFSLSNGVFNDIIAFVGGRRQPLLQIPGYFRTIYVASSIWQELGWSSIIYLAALTGVDPQLYEAAEIDGAGKIRQSWHITMPGIMPTIIMLLILNMGSILNIGFEKCLLLYNESTYETADIISTYVYRKGLIDANYSYSTAVGLFNSVVNMAFLAFTNRISIRAVGIGLF